MVLGQPPGCWTLLEPQNAEGAAGIPWGIEDESPYQQFKVHLSVGDIILCYTDSLAESRGADGEFLGTAGLLRVAGAVGNVNPSQLIPSLLSEIAKHDPAYGNRDDVTCLAFRPNWAAAICADSRFGSCPIPHDSGNCRIEIRLRGLEKGAMGCTDRELSSFTRS